MIHSPVAWSGANLRVPFPKELRGLHQLNYGSEERGLVDLTEATLQHLWAAYRRANEQLEPQGIRYELPPVPPSIAHLTSTAPGIDVSVDIRDVVNKRRLLHRTRFRISPRRSIGGVSVSVIDPLLKTPSRRYLFVFSNQSLPMALQAFQDEVRESLLERARRAFPPRRIV